MFPAHVNNLEVFKKAYSASLKVHHTTLEFPKFEQFEIASQLRRSSKSICANLIEGFGKNQSSKETARFITMAIGSCDEVKLFLIYAKDLGYLTKESYSQAASEYSEIGAMLYGLKNTLN